MMEAWAYVMVQVSVEGEVGKEVIDALSKWFGRHYPNTEPEGNGCSREMESYDGLMTILRFRINKRYDAHSVAEEAESKLNELLAAGS